MTMGLTPRPLDDRDQKIFLVIKRGIEGQTKLGVKPLGVCTGWIVDVTGVSLKCIYYRLRRLKRAGLVGNWKANGRSHWYIIS